MAKRKRKNPDSEKPVLVDTLFSDLLAATDADAILAALARCLWHDDNGGAECPADRIPTQAAIRKNKDWLPALDFVRLSTATIPDLYGAWMLHPEYQDFGLAVLYTRNREPKPDDVVQWVAQWPDFWKHPTPGFLPLARVHAYWLSLAPESERGPHPAADLVRAWQALPRPPDKVHMIVKRESERLTPEGEYPLTLARAPGALSLATLAVVQVDGEPFVTRAPDGEKVRMRKVIEPVQGQLFPYPRTLAGKATAGIFMQTLADMPIEGDGRTPLRADLWRLGNLAYALTGSLWLPESDGARLIGGKDSPQNRERFRRTVLAARGFIVLDKKTWEWYSLMDADRGPDGSARIGPPRWWTERPKGAPSMAFRLSGGLFVPVSRWGAVERTIAGLEGGLLWGKSAGRGRHGRLPDYVRPVRRGGPGPEVFISAWQVLRLSGEPVTADSYAMDSTARERYRQRLAALEAAGYKSTRTGTAHAGGTVEIVEQRSGRGHGTGGIVVRASARFCAAYQDGDEIRIPATQALPENR